MRCGNTKLVQEWLEDAKVWRWYEGGTQDQQDRLRQMGLEGWELVTVLSVTEQADKQ